MTSGAGEISKRISNSISGGGDIATSKQANTTNPNEIAALRFFEIIYFFSFRTGQTIASSFFFFCLRMIHLMSSTIPTITKIPKQQPIPMIT